MDLAREAYVEKVYASVKKRIKQAKSRRKKILALELLC